MEQLLLIILGIQGFILYLGQRKIFWLSLEVLNRPLAYLLAAPGTALHELAHYFMCKILMVPTGTVSLFRPRQDEDGGITLGYVEHGQSDPLRAVLIAIAPLLLVPPLLLLITVLLFGSAVIDSPWETITSASPLTIVIWMYISLSAGQGAFPSVGDHIGIIGGAALVLLLAAIIFIVPKATLIGFASTLALILALPSIAALLAISVLQMLHKRKLNK